MDKTYVAARDFTDRAGKPHLAGQPVSGLKGDEIKRLVDNGSITESKPAKEGGPEPQPTGQGEPTQ